MKSVIKISEKDIKRISKSKHRDELIASGYYNRPKHVVMKSKKDYNRKEKHKTDY